MNDETTMNQAARLRVVRDIDEAPSRTRLEHDLVRAESSAVIADLQGRGEDAAALRLTAWSLRRRLEQLGHISRATCTGGPGLRRAA